MGGNGVPVVDELLDGLPSHRGPQERLAALRMRPYVLLGALFTLLLLLPEVALISVRHETFPRIQQLLWPKGLGSWRDERLDEGVIAANLGVPLEHVYTTEQVLAAILRWGAIHDMRAEGAPIAAIPLGSTTLLVKPRAPLAFIWGPLGAYVLLLRRREKLHGELAGQEERKNEEMRAINETKIRELTAINRKMSDMQQKVLSAQKLASIGRLAATLAHEIRNPLTVIQSASGVIRDELQEESPAREAADLIQEEVVRLNRIITDLLNFSSPKPPRVTAHDVNDLIGGWVSRLEEELARKRVSIVFRPGNVTEAQLDPDQFYQVFLNIVWNARDAVMEVGGGLIEIGTAMEGATSVVVDIHDNGPGMSPVTLQQITEPFYTTKTKGTGLGLPVVVQLMEGMGGRFRVESQLEEGTRIYLGLQAAAPAENPATVRGTNQSEGTT